MLIPSINNISIINLMSQLQKLLFHDSFPKRDKWYNLFSNPVWIPQYDTSLATQRDIAYAQLRAVAASGLVSVQDFFNDPTNIFTAHEMVGTISGSTATKLTVHYNLFGGSIVALGTARHHQLFPQIDALKITGCFCLTELGYGNNAVQMETTATYDANTKEFIINSPTTLSQKYWITNGAVHANYALVFAQTIVKAKNQGVNAFLVPIRDQQLKAYPNVEIHDMGVKIGLNGVDNAALKFHNVRIPRVNLMNKYAEVDENGVFSSEVKGIPQRFFKVTERLLSGRLCIASMTLGGLKTMIYTSVKYSQQRCGVSPNGKSETPIWNYQLQQNAIVPVVSRCLALNMLHNFAKKAFATGEDRKDLLMICCVDKTLIGWHAERSNALLRERSGGQGFLAANVFGEGIASTHAALTAEGDNRVLMVKVVKDYLALHFKNQPISPAQGITSPLYDLLLKLQQHKLKVLVDRISALQPKSTYDILMYEVSDEIQSLALAYGERLAIQAAMQVKLTSHAELLHKHFTIFVWDILIREGVDVIASGILSQQAFYQGKTQYNVLIKECAAQIDTIVDSFNLPVASLRIPIAKDYVKYNSVPNRGEVLHAHL